LILTIPNKTIKEVHDLLPFVATFLIFIGNALIGPSAGILHRFLVGVN
jgi:hypothetical protein